MKKNDVINNLMIEDLGIHGEGIGHAEGMAIFVVGTIPGDVVTVGITKLKKTYAYARLISVEQASKDRVEPKCCIAKQCGGCQIQEMEYSAQLAWKERHVHNLLTRIGGFDDQMVTEITEPIIGMENPWNYRNKAQYPVAFGTKVSKDQIYGRAPLTHASDIAMGYYAIHSHRVIELPETETCAIGNAENAGILSAVKSWMLRTKVRPYDEESGEGQIRHVLIRHGVHTGEAMVCLVSTTAKLPDIDGLAADLLAVMNNLTSLCVNINKQKTNVILGRETRTLWGEDTIRDTVCGNTFEISAQSFFQVNPDQMERLYNKALEYAELSGEENVYDLYCGIGTISLALAKKAGHVTGVEIVPDAIRDAKNNAARNAISHAEFYCGPTEDVLPKLVEQGKSAFGMLSQQELRMEAMAKAAAASYGSGDEEAHANVEHALHFRGRPADVIVLDPPRKGCEPSVIDTILGVEPDKIVYVSCDPATLARDLKLFCASGVYQLVKVCPVDQFPMTTHVEVVSLLQRLSNTRPKAITLDVEMEDYYRIKGARTNG